MSRPHSKVRLLRLAAAALVILAAAIAGWKLAGRSSERLGEFPGPPRALPPAADLTARHLVVDTHIDLPYRLYEQGDRPDDVSRRTKRGDFDAVRAREGGLDVAWMSIYVPASYQRGDGAKTHADNLIELVEGIARRSPDLFALARTADEAERIARSGRIALPLGMENGAPLESDLENLRHFYDRGIRYITLTHSEDNLIADSSYSDPAARRWGGLSPFGREVIAEMNRLGILVDLSHVSDAAFDQAIAETRAPPIASHSSCRHFTPGFERNLDDDRIRALARAGGVIQINFGSAFLTAEANAWSMAAWRAEEDFVARTNAKEGTAELDEFRARYQEEHPFPRATIDDVVAHVDHVVDIAGIDHVGIGSDYDGVGPTLPSGLEDVSKYPALVARLLARGYSEEAIAQVLGGNFMRVWRAAEEVATELGGGRNASATADAPARPAVLD
jgi:membrane dipeptidase